mgnify:CR=1 FL=1
MDMLLPMLREIKSGAARSTSRRADVAARRIAHAAVKYSMEKDKETPYSMLASQEFNMVGLQGASLCFLSGAN